MGPPSRPLLHWRGLGRRRRRRRRRSKEGQKGRRAKGRRWKTRRATRVQATINLYLFFKLTKQRHNLKKIFFGRSCEKTVFCFPTFFCVCARARARAFSEIAVVCLFPVPRFHFPFYKDRKKRSRPPPIAFFILPHLFLAFVLR